MVRASRATSVSAQTSATAWLESVPMSSPTPTVVHRFYDASIEHAAVELLRRVKQRGLISIRADRRTLGGARASARSERHTASFHGVEKSMSQRRLPEPRAAGSSMTATLRDGASPCLGRSERYLRLAEKSRRKIARRVRVIRQGPPSAQRLSIAAHLRFPARPRRSCCQDANRISLTPEGCLVVAGSRDLRGLGCAAHRARLMADRCIAADAESGRHLRHSVIPQAHRHRARQGDARRPATPHATSQTASASPEMVRPRTIQGSS